MKKSLRLLAAAFVAIMLLSAVATPVAMAAITAPTFSGLSSLDMYILEQLSNAVLLSNGNYSIPGIGEVDGAKIRELYGMYWGSLYPSYNPNYPNYPTYPNYPFYPGVAPSVNVIDIEMNQYDTKNLALGTGYSYTSYAPAVVTVDEMGNVYAHAEGQGIISVSVDGNVWIYVRVKVVAREFDEDDYEVDLIVPKTLLTIGDSINVYARLMKDGLYVYQGLKYIVISSEDTDVAKVENGVLTAVGVGITTVSAYIPKTGLIDSVEIQVINKVDKPSTPSTPSTPNYPFLPNYPFFPEIPSYPDYPYYPGIGNTWYPGYSYYSWLGLDSSLYTLTYKMVFFQGEWQQILTAVPKDNPSLPLSEYSMQYKLMYKDGELTYLAYLVPKDAPADTPVVPETPKEEEKEDDKLSKEEQEALEKAEAEAKKQAELKKLIAKALEGKLEWYEVYTDLNGDASYYDGVEFALNNQYLSGKDNGKFGTKDAMTFDDVKALLVKYLSMTSAEFDKTGILTFKDGTKEITRQEITKAFYNLAVYLKEDVSGKASFARYTDKAQLSGEYSDSFAWAIKNHIILTTSKKMTPNGNVTRGDLARMLYRFDIFAD